MNCDLTDIKRRCLHRYTQTYIDELDFIERPVLVVDGNTLDSIEGGVVAVNDLAKDSVLAVKMCLLRICKEELGLVRVGARVSHGNNAARVELEWSVADQKN